MDEGIDLDVTTPLKDLSQHIFNLRIYVSEQVVKTITDDEYSQLLENIQANDADDFLVWAAWEGNYMMIDIAGTKSWQALADVSKPLRDAYKIQSGSVSFFRPLTHAQVMHSMHMNYMTAGDVRVTL